MRDGRDDVADAARTIFRDSRIGPDDVFYVKGWRYPANVNGPGWYLTGTATRIGASVAACERRAARTRNHDKN